MPVGPSCCHPPLQGHGQDKWDGEAGLSVHFHQRLLPRWPTVCSMVTLGHSPLRGQHHSPVQGTHCLGSRLGMRCDDGSHSAIWAPEGC